MLTNNQGLITRLNASLPNPEPFPNITLASDWDVTNEIACGLQTMQQLFTLQHVKGHQDSNTEYAGLSLKAQLNVNADAEAGFFQSMYPGQGPSIPRLPSDAAQLHLNGKVICARLKQQIREAATVPDYLSYVAKRFQWDSTVEDTIDWQAYTQATMHPDYKILQRSSSNSTMDKSI
jgi:hypothetical protein